LTVRSLNPHYLNTVDNMAKDIITLDRNGVQVEFSKTELVSLTKLWKMAGSPESQKPAQWNRLPETKKLVKQITKEVKGRKSHNGSQQGSPNMGKSHNGSQQGSQDDSKVVKTIRGGNNPETLAHYKIALEYAGYLSVEFKSWMLGIIGSVIEAPEDFAADILINSHNKDRVERAKKRVLVSGTNKETMELAKLDGASYAEIHNNRYRGLYRKNATQLREEAGLKKSETPLDRLSAYDLNLNSLANQMALMSGDSGKVLDAAIGLRQLHEQTVGKPLEPTWEEKHLRPSQAKAIAYSPEYQTELPVS